MPDFEREEWTLFRNIGTISQKAGVSGDKLRRLVVKELVDNALDAGATCELHKIPQTGAYLIQDDGPGISDDPAEVARIFSIRRPLASSKLLRQPTRGAMGNGLRVVTGAVLASNGWLVVSCRGKRFELKPQEDGFTAVATSDSPVVEGTTIEIWLGGNASPDSNELSWGSQAIVMADCQRTYGKLYCGRTSPCWYDHDTFFELCQAFRGATVREFIERFDGCSGATAGEIIGDLKGRATPSLSRSESHGLLKRAQNRATPMNPNRLGYVGEKFRLDGYARKSDLLDLCGASIPYTVEVWASRKAGYGAQLFVNGTPVTGNFSLYRVGNESSVTIKGCGLFHDVKVGRRPLNVTFNVIVPYMPITTDGKEPDLKKFLGAIASVMVIAARRAERDIAKSCGW